MESRDLDRAAETQDLDRGVFVTRYFKSLQGFRKVAFGLWLLPRPSMQALHLTGAAAAALPLMITTLLILVRIRIRTYYERRFGEINTKPVRLGQAIPAAMLTLFGAWLVVLQMVFHNIGMADAGMFGVFLIGTWSFRRYRISQGYYLGLGLLLLSAPFLGLHPGALPVMVSATMIVAGLLDHRQLVQALSHGAAFERDAMSETEVES